MLDLYFFPSPNGLKPLILLEETGLPYQLQHVDILRGAQFEPEFLRISPNNRIPALVDRKTGRSVFESGAVLIYIAEQAHQFYPEATAPRFEILQWLFWQVGGLGPMAGQAHHFRAFASEVVPYGIKRYTDECNRLYGVLERRLSDRDYVAGDYSIADMAIWPWIVTHERQGQSLTDFPRVADWFDRLRQRPAVQRAYAIGHEQQADATADQ
jgi:GST-like protein